MAEISKDAQSVLAGASPEAVAYATANAPGNKLTSGEAQILLSKFQADPNSVLSAGNIAQTTTNPVPRPDDLLGIRKALNTELGIDSLQQQFNDAYGQLNQFDTDTETLSRKINEQTLGTNVLRGQDATATNLRANERSGIARKTDTVRSALQAAQMERDQVFEIRQAEVQEKKQIMLQYPGAGITFGDSFETVTNKLNTYAKDQAKDARKQLLKDKLLELGQKTNGSMKDLEKRLKKVNKKAYEQTQRESDLKLQALELDIENTKSIIAERKNTSTNGGFSDSDVQAYVDAYGKGQITAPNIPTKIRDKVLGQAAPILKENALRSMKSDVQELITKNEDATKDQLLTTTRALYPELTDDEIKNELNTQIPDVAPVGFWRGLWGKVSGE